MKVVRQSCICGHCPPFTPRPRGHPSHLQLPAQGVKVAASISGQQQDSTCHRLCGHDHVPPAAVNENLAATNGRDTFGDLITRIENVLDDVLDGTLATFVQLIVAVLAVTGQAFLVAIVVALLDVGEKVVHPGAVGRRGSVGRVGWKLLGASVEEGGVRGDGACCSEGGSQEENVEIGIHGQLMNFYAQRERKVR